MWHHAVIDSEQNCESGVWECMQDMFASKAYKKIDAMGRLRVITALDNGGLKTDLAKEYGVHPQTITYIYNQKNSILKRCKLKLLAINDIKSLNLDHLLLEWFKEESSKGNEINEGQLLSKAMEILDCLNEELLAISEWLENFQLRHNILKVSRTNNKHDNQEWHSITEGYDDDDIYIGGTCALNHKVSYKEHIQADNSQNQISLFLTLNSSSQDKRQLMLVGSEPLEFNSECEYENIKSIPVVYHYCQEEKPHINEAVLIDYFKEWDLSLKSQNRKIILLLDIHHEYLANIETENIKIVKASNIDFVTKKVNRIILCFKYQYRKMLLIRHSNNREEVLSPLSYIQMMSLAWYSISDVYLKRLFHPQTNGSLYMVDIESDFEGDTPCSLSSWSQNAYIDIDESICKHLDNYTTFDNDLVSIKGNGGSQIKFQANSLDASKAPSAIEAFQAMKRLMAGLQAEAAGPASVAAARRLEQHIELEALAEINKFINDTTVKLE